MRVRDASTAPEDATGASAFLQPPILQSLHLFRTRIAKLEVDKENRPPRGMAKGKGNITPGRRRKAQDQYFDVGKVGRYARALSHNSVSWLTGTQKNGHHTSR